jgi:hypothetical protein
VQPHSPLLATQTGVSEPVMHSTVFVDEHCVHSPASVPDIWQAGVGAVHSALFEHGMHVFVVMLQMGEVPEQSVFIRHPTQMSFAGLHMGVGDAQSMFARHATQAPISAPEVAQ